MIFIYNYGSVIILFILVFIYFMIFVIVIYCGRYGKLKIGNFLS